MVGACTCLIPPLYLYSIGDIYRGGAEGAYRRSGVMTAAYSFAAFIYLQFIPFPIGLLPLFVYWGKVLKNLPANRPQDEDLSEISGGSAGEGPS